MASSLVPFGVHLLEHAAPLGLTREPARFALPYWAGAAVLAVAGHCVAATSLGIAFALATAAFGRLPGWAKLALLLLAILGGVCMRDMTAILRSCWGEAPHFPWRFAGW